MARELDDPFRLAQLLLWESFGHLGAGNHALAPIWFTLLGEVYLTARQLAEARGAVESDHAAAAAQAGQPLFDAEPHRLEGELVLATGGAPAEAEAPFRDRDRSRAGGEGPSSCARDEPRPPVARPGQSRRGARPRRRKGAARELRF